MNTRLLVLAAALLVSLPLSAAEAVSGLLTLTVSNGVKSLAWPRTLIPALETNKLSVGTTVTALTEIPAPLINVGIAGYSYSASNALSQQFFALHQAQVSSNDLLTANVLNRLAYGPTPDELERVKAIGPQAYIDEQLAMENFVGAASEPTETVITLTTNAGTGLPLDNWETASAVGQVTSSTLYMYLAQAGSVQVDDVQLRYSYVRTAVTNNGGVITTTITTNLTDNLLVNGDFEQPLTTGWAVAANHSASFLDNSVAKSGTNSLRMIASSPGTTLESSISQTVAPAPVTTRGTNVSTGVIYTNTISTVRMEVTYSYLPSATSRELIFRSSGGGLRVNARNGVPGSATPTWVYAEATGRATGTPQLYLYLSSAGQVYIDDLKLVAGTTAGAGANLLQNPSFETGVLTPWLATPDFTNSEISTEAAFSGTRSLKLVATAAGEGNGDSFYQANIAGLANNSTYTVSYWYVPDPDALITVRLSGSLLVSSPESTPAMVRQRLDATQISHSLSDPRLADLRGWFCGRSVSASGQLMEVLLQFLENHFVTQHSKTSDYLDRYYDGTLLDRIPAALEYRENARWRQALSDPNCTFYDLLKISAESPAMIIYLDTVGSRADGTRIANENYARELFELFCMGVDNGYDQNDIVAMSRAWTGWTVNIVDSENVDNPFAARASKYVGLHPDNGFNVVSNLIGVWTFSFDNTWHGTNRAPILSVWNPNSPPDNPIATGPKLYPARFGPPWAGTSYQLTLPRRTGNAGMQDGYDVLRHLADLAFTQEYLSVKFCRLFIHEHFEHGVYDYTDPNRSPEAELIRQCMVAWQTPGPDGRRGNIRAILRTIFNSELFRSHGGSRQKVKTPLEFLASSVRALRSANPDGTFTATTDGISFIDPLSRMGSMSLFNRADPDGYPEAGAPWISAGTLAERLRFAQSFLTAPTTANRPTDAGNNFSDPVALLKKKLPVAGWNNSAAVSDFFLSIFFPGEGRANLDLYRLSAINFLNTNDDGVSTSFFGTLPNTGAIYDTRVRGLVSLLMTTQRFQEQ
jgi:uncharacterized protein (DUF1800 family)